MRLRDGYKKAALNHKLNGDRGSALKMIRTAKQLDILLQAIAEGKPVDLRGLPAPAPTVTRRFIPPSTLSSAAAPLVQVTAPADDVVTDAAPTRRRMNPEEYTRDNSSTTSSRTNELTTRRGRDPSPSPSASSSVSQSVTMDDVARLFNAPTSANSVLEALNQRIEKYKATEEAAKSEGNASKARRLGRIVKQYENAIDAYKHKKDFDFDSLPVPPGFPPIPFDLPVEPSRRVRGRAPDVPSSSGGPSPVLQKKTAPAPPVVLPVERPKTELNAKVDHLVQLQTELKHAAVEHKRQGDVAKALELLRLAKGFDPILEAVKCGLPVDESTIPQIPEDIMSRMEKLKL